MEQRYFEQRAMFGGMAPGMGMFDGYRKGQLRGLSKVQDGRSGEADLISGFVADALLGRTFFNGLKWDPQVLADRCE
jgi:hypothetical protein